MNTLFKLILVITLIAIVIVVTIPGCKNETASRGENQEITDDSVSAVAQQEPIIVIPDIKGTWTGTFDKRTTTLTITEQTDSNFSGKISIKYKETINQDVKGTFRPATQKVSMEDQVHSKYMGKYDGKLSDDGNNLSGTFTMNRDGTKTSFNLNKK